MKLLYINILYAPHVFGGAEGTLQTLAEGMAARGHEVTVLSTGPDTGVHEDEVNGIRVLRAGVQNLYWHSRYKKQQPWKRMLWHLRDAYNPAMGKVVENVVKEIKPDLVSLHNLPGFSVAAWNAVHRAGIPMVQVLHDQYLLCPRSTMFRNNRICKRQCLSCRTLRMFHPRLSGKVTAVVGVSRFILDHHLRFGYFKHTKIKDVIHNARLISIKGTIQPKRTDGKIRFGFIGTLAQSKGIELLLRVFKENADSNWELHIAGEGPKDYECNLRNRFAAPNVIFHGKQRQEDFYPHLDALVVPSQWNEPLGVVVFEAMAYGLPVIGAKRGGIPEMVVDGRTGLMFEADRPEELSTAMNKIARDYKFRTDANEAARSHAKYFLDCERFLYGYEKVYEQATGMGGLFDPDKQENSDQQ